MGVKSGENGSWQSQKDGDVIYAAGQDETQMAGQKVGCQRAVISATLAALPN